MRAKRRVLLTGICLCVIFSTVQAQLSDAATEAYLQKNWQAAIINLETQQSEPGALHMLALSYFFAGDFNQALPAFEKALLSEPNDIELNTALLDVLLADQNIEQAEIVANHLENLGAHDVASFGLARIGLTKNNRALALSRLNSLVESADPALAVRAADILIEALYDDQQFDQAYLVAQIALQRNPDSAFAYRFARILPVKQVESKMSFDLGYRFEYDDNITYPDDVFASGKEDFRNVLMADILYQRPFADGWNFYAQGHVFQSFHNDFDQFDQTRLSAAVSVGRNGEKIGWRLPLEINHDRFDGDSFRTSLAAIPGLQLPFGENYYGYFYARLQSDDYDRFPFPEEDRSGDVMGAGVLLDGQVSPRTHLRGYLEFNRYDTDGLYWERDEIVAFAHAEFELMSKLMAGVAIQYKDENYDNARLIFAQRQQDESRELYLNLTHRFAEHWWWRGQVSLIDHQSNIPIFDYDRNVYSIGLFWEF